MTARLSRLRIAGFKSFAEPVSLDILPGLTGIVGPNGCGKSNVVEALRWAMGETSARSLRGGEMDDVIFAGTTARASRNLAEVTITLEAGDEALPAPHEAEAELQVTRRIERGAGSQFRVNGRDARARDVQTLYADLASGARSSGMVSQGRVSQLVNAKPEERRQVLEEAAGITGLHARRHEAELKLRAAEQNLSRAEDVRLQLDTAREAMRKQARQAARYRNISGLIRAAESEHLSVLLGAATAALEAATQTRETADEAARQAARDVEAASGALDAAETALPGPRAAVSEAGRTLERRRIEAEGFAAEAERVRLTAEAAGARLLELEADLDSAERARADAGASVARLRDEARELAEREAALPHEISRLEDSVSAGALDVAACSQAAMLAQERSQAARLAAAHANATAQACVDRLAAAEAGHAAASAESEAADAALVPADKLESAERYVGTCADDLMACRADCEAAEQARVAASRALAARQAEVALAEAARIEAERALQEARIRADRLGHAFAQAEEALRRLVDLRLPAVALEQAREAAAAAARSAEAGERHLEACEREAAQARVEQADAARHVHDLAARTERTAQALRAALARLDRLGAELGTAEAALDEAARSGPDADALAQARQHATDAEIAFSDAGAALAAASAERGAADAALAAARAAADRTAAAASRIAGEAAGLADAMGGEAEGAGTLAGIVVAEGLEAALGAALGDGEAASLSAADERFWRALPAGAAPGLPCGSVALAGLVEAPPALARLLAHTAVLDDGADGDAVQADLAPGVTAVRRDGASWRWDGHVVRPGAPNAAAVRLGQRRRLAVARAAGVQADAGARAASDAALLAEAAEAAAAAAERAARAAMTEAERRFRACRAVLDRMAADSEQAQAIQSSLAPAVVRLRADRQAAEDDRAAEAASFDGLADPGQARAAAHRAEIRARDASAALDAARLARQAARSAWMTAQDRARGLEQDAAEIEAKIAAASPALDELGGQRAEADARLAEARAAMAEVADAAGLADVAQAESEARAAESGAREARQRAEQSLDDAREKTAALRAASAEAESRQAALAAMLGRAGRDRAEAEAALAACTGQLVLLADPVALEAEATGARRAHEAARTAWQAHAAALETLKASLLQVGGRARQVGADLAAWRTRHDEAEARAEGLGARCEAARAAWQALEVAPDDMSAKAARAHSALAEAEAEHVAALGLVSEAERHARARAVALRDGEQRLSTCREARARGEASHEAALGAVQAVMARAAERLGATAALAEPADLSDAAEERARKKFERLSRERDEMGPVNLRAELELSELEERAAELDREREDLSTAIAKLRGAIGHLNREGRERLTTVFTQVNQHFSALFTRMMGGGRAHLALTGSDDPLMAGLEIFAEPPGKKLSSLALLSGGEQALTALSLIFAVFRCTPAPISVLDEVDAPLDDANVERFCALLDDVVRDTGTRFLVVTHHQLTMSRMDRLFGVTMQERGVSRLLSVDLRRAVAMVEPVMQAAE